MRRRAQGVLEQEVLATLWAAESPLSPEQVRTELASDLAYTTVATTLSRLLEKGAVRRTLEGRHHVYEPVLDDAGMTARRMRLLLDAGADSGSVLSRFVAELSATEEAALRRALAGEHR